MACDPKQPDYVHVEKKIIRICKSLLTQFYLNIQYPDGDVAVLDGPTEAYENCGAWQDPDPIL